jgi:hypothetical protein
MPKRVSRDGSDEMAFNSPLVSASPQFEEMAFNAFYSCHISSKTSYR